MDTALFLSLPSFCKIQKYYGILVVRLSYHDSLGKSTDLWRTALPVPKAGGAVPLPYGFYHANVGNGLCAVPRFAHNEKGAAHRPLPTLIPWKPYDLGLN